ncbi:MAG: hypothetical protein ACKPKO_49425, partial [Candidatus Fonsibacter sp.]
MLDEMRAKDRPRWHALVRQCRIRNDAVEIGVAAFEVMQKQVVIESTQIMSQAFGVRDTCGSMWLTKERVIAHQIYVRHYWKYIGGERGRSGSQFVAGY